MTKEEIKPFAVYDESEIHNEDYDAYWEDCENSIQEWIDKQKDSYFKCWVNSFGWAKRSGYTTLKLSTAENFIRHILPNCDKTFYCYEEKATEHVKREEYIMKIVCYHHDSPMGDTYYLRPLTESELEELE